MLDDAKQWIEGLLEGHVGLVSRACVGGYSRDLPLQSCRHCEDRLSVTLLILAMSLDLVCKAGRGFSIQLMQPSMMHSLMQHSCACVDAVAWAKLGFPAIAAPDWAEQ